MDSSFIRYKIEDRSYVAFLKREIHMKAFAVKFNATEIGKIDIIVSELTSNLVKHVGEGELLYRVLANGNGEPVFEIICIDKGVGIEDTSKAMRDGMSTTRTLGQGLGALDRLSSSFHMMSLRKWGTVVYSRVGPSPRTPDIKGGAMDVDVRALLVPKPLEEVCGDGFAIVSNKSFVKILFGDGLGHGPHAKEAVDTAKDFFFECEETDPVDILKAMHDKVRRTRGLVGSVAVLDRKTGIWMMCGIGNIITRLYSGIEYRNYMSYNGTIGLNIPKSMNATVIPADRHQHLIMSSDGLSTRWDIAKYPSVFKYDLFILAGALYKDFSRGNDDSSVLIAKVV
jgi:anti-sigma regulatory factor (Ser/Thr protein kinase)